LKSSIRLIALPPPFNSFLPCMLTSVAAVSRLHQLYLLIARNPICLYGITGALHVPLGYLVGFPGQ
jgi:hypothetical protein